ncbi:MAG: acyltransferase domain-containing protein, partial [Deltaproteobacteria bacterium]|nr:acyltransferase domain-containing protein [Deltaproteobacteria bacterium]
MKQNLPIAIIGMGCLFPKSPGLKAYWRLLYHGVDGITDIPETHWSPKDYYDHDPLKPDHVYCKRGGFLPEISFDPTEFGIPPSSLEAIDTSQILGLVVAKDALEDAGYGKNRAFNREKTSVILGVTGTQELVIPLGSRLGHPKWRKALQDSGISPTKTEEIIERISDSYVPWQENSFPGLLGNVVAGRICNRLDLGGTNCVVDAACASSMSAIHLAVMELAAGRSDMVISGGVDAINDIFMHMCFSKTHTLSRTGDARPFSKHADGTVLGEGVGMVVLKRLREAENDGDRIYAVIKAVGSSSDGKSQSIYAPRKEGQVNALRHAYTHAAVDPTSVELIETHGTGTRVGDAVEFQALSRFFGERKGNDNRCAVGSVKSNIGHTKAAAGAAGLIKSALALYNKVLPPTLKANEPDPDLRIHETPFYLCTETRPWFLQKEHPRRAGVSAFGFGGSNFHAVLEEHNPKKQDIRWDGSVEILALSSSTRKGLLERLRTFIDNIRMDFSPAEISKTTAQTRQIFSCTDPHRLLFVLEQPIDLHPDADGRITRLFTGALNALESNRTDNSWQNKDACYGGPEKQGNIAFLFPGQGSQYVGMCRDLICSFPSAFDMLEKSNDLFKTGGPLSDLIFPPPARTRDEKTLQENALRKTDVAQPALGAVSLALMKILLEFNVKPDATGGHSYGELTALCAAGWFDTDTLIRLSMSRGEFMAGSGQNSDQGEGAMLAVKAPLDELSGIVDHIGADIVLANRNAPDQGVLSGPLKAIDQADDVCKQKGFRTVKLPVSAAFHSRLVSDAQKPFMASLRDIDFSPSGIPVYANTTGEPYPSDSDAAKTLLGEQILRSVNFINQIENMFASGIRTFVEIGPKSVLTGLVKSILKERDFQAIALDSASGKRSGMADLARALCRLAALGYPVELTRWEPPGSVKRKQRMQIPISGANYRNPETKIKKEQNKINVAPVSHTMNKDTKTKHQPTATADVLKVVQEGLKSIQALQMQTAEVHKKFLETQAEAGRTLQNMMENTQRLAQASLGLSIGLPEADAPVLKDALKTGAASEPSVHRDADENRIRPVPDALPQIRTDTPDYSAPPFPVISETSLVEPGHVPDSGDVQPEGTPRKEIETHMLSVVSRLTGYPAEMLGLDMDIESDLGIDSIKRVEILSALEEKIPGLPSISPENVGKLKTLGQISEYLSEGSEPPASAPLPDRLAASSGIERETIENSMLAVVSRLTGYPAEMLGLDMDIEADLGIDSIKRVEILSALEEKIPDLPSISPENVGKLKTLGQIAEYLSGSSISDAVQTKKETTAPVSPVSGEKNAKKLKDGLAEEKLPYSLEQRTSTIHRNIVSIVHTPLNVSNRLSIPDSRKIYITDDKSGLSKSIADEFTRLNMDTVILSDDLFSDVVAGRERLKDAGGLIIVPKIRSVDDRFLKDAFLLTKHAAQYLLDAAAEGAAFFATVTRLDGAFGFKGRGVVNPLQGGLAGLAKTASL